MLISSSMYAQKTNQNEIPRFSGEIHYTLSLNIESDYEQTLDIFSDNMQLINTYDTIGTRITLVIENDQLSMMSFFRLNEQLAFSYESGEVVQFNLPKEDKRLYTYTNKFKDIIGYRCQRVTYKEYNTSGHMWIATDFPYKASRYHGKDEFYDNHLIVYSEDISNADKTTFRTVRYIDSLKYILIDALEKPIEFDTDYKSKYDFIESQEYFLIDDFERQPIIEIPIINSSDVHTNSRSANYICFITHDQLVSNSDFLTELSELGKVLTEEPTASVSVVVFGYDGTNNVDLSEIGLTNNIAITYSTLDPENLIASEYHIENYPHFMVTDRFDRVAVNPAPTPKNYEELKRLLTLLDNR